MNQLQPGFSDIEIENLDDEFNHSEETSDTQKLIDLLRFSYWYQFIHLEQVHNWINVLIFSKNPICRYLYHVYPIQLT